MRGASSLSFVALIALSGCFPYRQTYQPGLKGLIVDASNHPRAGVDVVACSLSHWTTFSAGCEVRTALKTDEKGHFELARATKWEWITLLPGEAPLPYTLIIACGPDGTRGALAIGPEQAMPVLIRLKAPPLTVGSLEKSVRVAEDAEEFIARTCAGGLKAGP